MRRSYWLPFSISLLANCAPAWALIDGIVSGAQAVKDQAHQRIIENQMIQLVIAAKKNYDASASIYKEVKRLNEGRGLIRNISSDLGAKAKGMADDEKETFASDFSYRGDSAIDRQLEEANNGLRRGIAGKGIKAVDRYGNAIDKRSDAYVQSFTKQAEDIWKRRKKADAGRQEGVKIAQGAPDMTTKALGLGLQTYADTAEALNELLKLEMLRDAEGKKRQIVADREIAEALKFLADKKGMAKALEESFFMVRLSRAPGLFWRTRQAVSKLVSLLLAIMLAAGLLYEFAKNGKAFGGFVPEVLGLPLVCVVFGLIFYDKIFVSFAVIIDALEQTISPGQAIVSNTLQVSSDFSVSPLNLMNSDYWIKYFSLFLGSLSWAVSIVFLWVRFAFFCLLYSVGPLFIGLALFEPIRKLTYGWMMAVLHVALWGVFMRILSLVVVTSGISAFSDSSGGVVKSIFASLVVNLIFLAFGVLCPYFTSLIVGGHIGEKAAGLVSPVKGFLARRQG